MKVLRKIIEIDEELCDGCGECIPGCAEGALQIIDGKAKVVDDKFCDGLGACLGDCPNDALKIVEREAEEFDEEAVEKHLEEQAGKEKPMPCGCPSSQIMDFTPKVPKPEAVRVETESALSHWPVQIRLIPPDASFLKGADLLVLADCVPVAFPSVHADMLPGKAVMVGCPKLDDAQEYIDKFAAVFQKAGLKSVTVSIMEVPCCSGLVGIIEEAMKKSGANIPVNRIVVSTRGKIIEQN